MNGIEKISARILADAETEAAAIRAQAEEKAAQIRTDYDRRIESEQQRLTAEAQAEAEKQLARDQGAARMAARRQLLETKQSLVDAAFRQAEQQLLSLLRGKEEQIPVEKCGLLTAFAYPGRIGRARGRHSTGYLLSGGSGTAVVYDLSGLSFSPQIKVEGDTDEDALIRKLRDLEPEFIDFILEALSRREGGAYVTADSRLY